LLIGHECRRRLFSLVAHHGKVWGGRSVPTDSLSFVDENSATSACASMSPRYHSSASADGTMTAQKSLDSCEDYRDEQRNWRSERSSIAEVVRVDGNHYRNLP
jgi:hypothetical protein